MQMTNSPHSWYNSSCLGEQNTGAFCFLASRRRSTNCIRGHNAPYVSRTFVLAVHLDNDGAHKGRYAMETRNMSYKRRWQELIDRYGPRCFYCRKEIATTIDHVVPYSWDQDNDIENLVPACVLCNALASNKMFDDVEQKRQYIMGERKKRANQNVICRECLLPYSYRIHSPSLFMCAECYDDEYGTKNAASMEWRRWIETLRIAGIPAQAHRAMKKRMKNIRAKDIDAKLEVLIDEYSNVINTDRSFAEMLVLT